MKYSWEGGVESCWRPYSAEFYTLYVTRFRTYKIAYPPQDKNLEEERPQADNQLPQSPVAVYFYD